MATPKPRDPLDALQVLLNDVLVQTGKALRASRRDGQGNSPLPQGLSQSKLPVTIDAFQRALDDIEGDIMKAKSVILRDLNQLQADQTTGQQQHLQPALPIESQTKHPVAIDVDSSPPPSTAAHTKPALAPFPVMDAGDMTNSNAVVKSEDNTFSSINSTTSNAVKTEGPAAPEAPMMPESNFTDMQFSLAPGDGSQGQNTTGTSSFDMSSFAPSDTILTLDSMLPGTAQPTDLCTSNTEGGAATTATTAEAVKAESHKDGGNTNDSNFEDFFTNDASQADGMDFDFSLGGSGGGGGSGGNGGGMGEDTFDDLMNDRDGTFELMSNEDFDAAFFGLDNKDGTS
ncbi:hypothetical protein LLEC1_00671 [Akanthomyces lecanii]|uniref:Uncharacterized protein n=1 Tax=Cordyceps confragosa TaxID=2714763 RepID=A0A179IJC2_CORDF|nr:hypothetical protein LLEC1_00671 [Akanthomyces lecanii]